MEINDLVAMVIGYLRERPPAWTRRVPPKVTAKRAMELLWQATDKKRRRRIRAKSLFVILAVLLVGCGPSKAEVAVQKCDAALAVEDYDTAVLACREARRLNPHDMSALRRELRAMSARDMRNFEANEERLRHLTLLERNAEAAERAAAAAEQQANTLARAESRTH